MTKLDQSFVKVRSPLTYFWCCRWSVYLDYGRMPNEKVLIGKSPVVFSDCIQFCNHHPLPSSRVFVMLVPLRWLPSNHTNDSHIVRGAPVSDCSDLSPKRSREHITYYRPPPFTFHRRSISIRYCGCLWNAITLPALRSANQPRKSFSSHL